MRHDVGGQPTASRVLEAVHRSLLKPRKAGFTQALLESIKPFEIRTAAGIYLGDAASYDVDFRRLGKVMGRTTRGLYFREFSERLPDTHGCVVYALAGVAADAPGVAPALERLVQRALAEPPRVFGDKVFAYWVVPVDGPATVWFYLLYGKVVFLAATMLLTDIGQSNAAA